MNDTVILKKLELIFRDIFGKDTLEINMSTNANDIEEWDSLTHISILASVQDDFGVSFDMDEIIEMKNVGDMVEAIKVKCNG